LTPLLKRLDRALGQALWRAVSGLISRLPSGDSEQRAPAQSPDSDGSATAQEPDAEKPDLEALSVLKETPSSPVEPAEPEEPKEPKEPGEQVELEEPATDSNSLLHRLAAGGPLSQEGTTLCQRLIGENPGYQPDSVLEAAVSEGKFNPDDLAKIAAFLVSVYYEPGADTSTNESLARTLFEQLAERCVATPELVKLCVQAMADAPCESLTRPVGLYLMQAGGMVEEYRALVIAAFNPANYSAYCGKLPAAGEKRAPPADWNEWAGYNAWCTAGQEWPLADLFLELDTGGEIDALLAQEPPAGIPAEHTLQYFLLRRSWLKARESPGSLRSLGRLLRATAAKPQWKSLHDRGVLVFRDAWLRGQYGRATALAAEAYQGLLRLQPRVDPGNPPDRLPGMVRLHPAGPPPQETAERLADPDELLLPSSEALLKRFKWLRDELNGQPDNPGAWHEIAGIYGQLSLWDKAIIAEGLAIEHHPKYAVAYYGRGKARMEARQWDEAIADFSTAIRLWEYPGGLEKFLTIEEPRDEYVDSYRTRGVARAHQGDQDAAIGDVSTAVGLRRHNPRLRYELAYLQERAGRAADASVEAYTAGLLYLDRAEKEGAAECVSLLDRLEAHEKADSLRIRMSARKPSDLPD
jgi:tetratricopeptide (TPR) repeat protein